MTSLRFGLAAALALICGLNGPVRAEQPVVVELFTSQGCNNCPPADALLAELSEAEDVIALAFHVDYWDAFGWADPFSSPESTRRQEDYARRFGVQRRYTPQMVVDASAEMVGHERRIVGKALRRARAESRPAVRVSVVLGPEAQEGRISLTPIEGARPPAAEATIWLAGYDATQETLIAGGQNADRRLTYCNVVREWRPLTVWDGEESLNLSFERPKGDGGLAVIVQEGGIGRILGAAHVRYGR